MTNFIRSFKDNRSGASAAEYALIIGLVGVAIIAGATLLGQNINTRLNDTAVLVATP
nr:Flp family type IVb pilin [Polymorphobacter sp.]